MAKTAKSTSDVHTRKRPYQPSITSFFNRNADLTASGLDAGDLTSPLSPPLPAETQASLLSVGMRVRKSVPEGYKTHKTLGPDGFPFPSTAPTAVAAQRPMYNSQDSSRELTPFCGLHKTGGFGQQEGGWVPASSAPAAMQGQEDEEPVMPGLSMSQSTLSGTQGSFRDSGRGSGVAAHKKRGFEEDIEDDMDDYFDEVDSLDVSKSGYGGAERPMARLKGAMKGTASAVTVRGMGDDDFEEAGFLAPRDGMDVDA